MPTFAAVDIGANSVRLKISRWVHQRLRVIHEDREVVRLGESVFAQGMLSPAAMARTVKVLRRFHKAAREHGAEQVRVIATSALRDARNGQAFIDWVHMRTGWSVEVVSGIEEARLIHLGVITSLRITQWPLLLIDLGGGSCELTISAKNQIRETVSLPLGAVRLTQEFLRHDPPREDELEQLHGLISEEIRRVARRINSAHVKAVIATSGTAAALATSAQAIRGAKNTRDTAVQATTLVRLADMLALLSYSERTRIRGIGTRRAEIIVAGAAVFAELVKRCNLPGFRYSPLGLRDGMLVEMAASFGRNARSTRQLAIERWDSLLAAGKHYQVDTEQAQHVRHLVLEVFAALRSVHRLPPEYEEWLSAAAMLMDAGAYVNRTGWHRHTHYIIANSEILGYTPQQRRIIAAISRYLGSSLPSPSHKVIRALDPLDGELVPKAVALLRMARALNQGRRKAVLGVRGRERNGMVTLKVRTSRRISADLELWALRKERGYFRAVFGRELEAEAS